MAQRLTMKHYDVVVIGGGTAGVTASLAAKANGANTLLVESSPYLGGELISGLPIDGCLNSLGEWIVGGFAREMFDVCKTLDGYIGPVFDWRTMWGVCLDPDVFKLAIVQTLARYRVPTLLYTFAEDVVTRAGRLEGVIVVNKSQRMLLTADVFVDCSGDADIAVLAGASYELGGGAGVFQPVSLTFRMGNVDYMAYLEYCRDNPDQFLLAENPIIGKTRAECAAEAYKSGLPFICLSAEGSLLTEAIRSGEMYPTMGIFTWPTSIQRREVGLNATRVADIDATHSEDLSTVLTTLVEQVLTSARFMKRHVPGFSSAYLAGTAPRVGVRETRRIIGEYVLNTDDVLKGRKSADGIAKGGHHVDIHGSGTYQKRVPIEGGKSYDIPYGCLIPKGLENVLVAGRCISSSREANGSARVMGTCMAVGQAAGTAAALCRANGWSDVREVPIEKLRATLRAQGAILDGTR